MWCFLKPSAAPAAGIRWSSEWLLLLVLFVQCVTLSWSGTTRQWSSRVVTTRLGLVRGFLFVPPKGGYEGVEVFLGLPYASAPVGSLRFMPPVSGSPWAGTKMTPHPAPVCPQVLPSIQNETETLKGMPRGRLAILKRLLPLLQNQSEDCLYLNIYVPLSVSEKGGAQLPVLVFVHGNDYGYGGGHPYDPSMLVSQGQVIVVTMNYRLGILGFLNANSDGYFKSPANFCLLDIIAALHFVQENIGSFGGDRSNVTLMGHGKGGIFVNFLMISSAVPTGLLFNRVILMSGSALSSVAVGSLSKGKELAKRFGSTVNCPNEPPSEMLNCLRQTPLDDFLESDLWSQFGPSEDGVTIEDGLKEPVLRDRLSYYPLLFGVTKVEMLPFLGEHDAVFGIETERRREILKGFIEKHFSVHRNEILAAAIHEYTEWERPIQHPISVRDETLDALGDAQVVAPLVKIGDFHSQSNQKSFFYVFEYQSKGSDYLQRLGCVHGEDLVYVFGVPLYFYGNDMSTSQSSSLAGNENSAEPDETSLLKLGFFNGNFTRSEVQMSQMVIHFWANFIRTGNPNDVVLESEGGSSSGGNSAGSRLSSDKSISKSKVVEWPHYDPLYKKYLTIDMKPRQRTHYRAHKLSFWLHLVPDLMKNGYGVLSGSHHHTVDVEQGNHSATPAPPTIQLVGPPLWEHNTNNKQGGQFFPDNLTHSTQDGGTTGLVTHSGQGQDGDGYQLYSTALSVTIAIGCSLLILNILIFAAFYYQRDKRRNEGMAGYSDGTQPGHSYQGESSNLTQFHQAQQHRTENGQVGGGSLQLHAQMPNICGDLPSLIPPPESSDDIQHSHQLLSTDPYGAQHLPRGQQLKRNKNLQQSAYEMTMPDAIVAAAMMSMHQHQQHFSSPHSHGGHGNHHDHSAGGSPGMDYSHGTLGRGHNIRRSSLTLKDQHGSYGQTAGGGPGCSVIHESGSRTMPRPPRRSTPSVKFSCEGTNGRSGGDGEGSCSSNSASMGGESGCAATKQSTLKSPQQSQQHQPLALKPSLKKSSNYPGSTVDELKV